MKKFGDKNIGDSVHSKKYGEGIIVGIDKDNEYPIRVKFAQGFVSYTISGLSYNDMKLYLSDWSHYIVPSVFIFSMPIEKNYQSIF